MLLSLAQVFMYHYDGTYNFSFLKINKFTFLSYDTLRSVLFMPMKGNSLGMINLVNRKFKINFWSTSLVLQTPVII